jgi:hypothetical protein
MARGAEPQDEGLNEDQRRHLLVSCQYVDKLLSDIERILVASSAKSPFPRYRSPLPPAERAVVEDHVALIRARLVRVLAEHGITIQPGKVDTLFAIRSALKFADNAVEELGPRHMRKYGDFAASAVPRMNTVVEELRGVVQELDQYLAGNPS